MEAEPVADLELPVEEPDKDQEHRDYEDQLAQEVAIQGTATRVGNNT